MSVDVKLYFSIFWPSVQNIGFGKKSGWPKLDEYSHLLVDADTLELLGCGDSPEKIVVWKSFAPPASGP
jgi:hypothetical protein